MQNKKMRFFSLIGYATLVVLLAACGSTALATNTTTASNTSKVVLGNGTVKSIGAATLSGDFHDPLDSTPDLNGTTIYFTATGPHGQGVFQVPAAGGPATEVFTGSPFVSPRALEVSLDGRQIYVTDPGASNGGGIFALPIQGGTPTLVPGSEQTAPQNLDLVKQNGQQIIYFTGKDPKSGQPAVLTLPLEGANAASVVAEGSPLVAPDGIVVTHTGALYVSDRSAAGGDFGQIFKIEGNNTKAIVDKIHTGNPAGIALSPNESILFVSAHQLNSTADQVLLIDLSTLETGSATAVVGQNHSAGGLHESHDVKHTYSWADLTAGSAGTGIVYRVEFK